MTAMSLISGPSDSEGWQVLGWSPSAEGKR